MSPSSDSSIGIAVIGAGTVGNGVLQLLRRQQAHIRARCGRTPEIVHIVKRDLTATEQLDKDLLPLLSDDWRAAVADPKTDIVVELMGGTEDAALCINAALAAKKPVVTANKALLAETPTLQAAAAAGVPLAHEAAIAGCIPIVKILREGLAGDTVNEIYGIINGTCNYILTAMEADKIPFADALASAQQQGFAEADPQLDIDGMDAAHKLILIARLAFGVETTMAELPITGVRDFDWRDIFYAGEFNFRIKLLAMARMNARQQLEIGVRPMLIPQHDPLAAVEGAMNAVLVRSQFAGETMYYGAGAGAHPTAVAVVADIIDMIRRGNGNIPSDTPAAADLSVTGDFSAAHYLRLRVFDRPGVLADITRLLAQEDISIEAIHQNESMPNETVDVIILLHAGEHRKVGDAVRAIEQLPVVDAPVVILPIARLET